MSDQSDIQSKQKCNLYKEVVTICEDYFGPAAPRYIERIAKNHFSKSPEQLKCEDLPELTEWICLILAITTEKENEVEELTERLSNLYTANKKLNNNL